MEPTKFNLDPKKIAGFILLGAYFGIVLIKSEVVSWFRIQEMFRFDSFHMYGIIGSAIVVAALSIMILNRIKPTAATGVTVSLKPKTWEKPGTRYIVGGFIFGLGWALLGACPGPIYALLGTGVSVILVALLAAVGGAFAYGSLQHKLRH